ncbi:hypothetical protein [Paenarthrobacter sp. CAP02]|uniref:IclR family transcriptional regulator domain-containing protein n=1 Tax=Paenarthrobacter sp. CAP02 TaxID=3158144 RepID=UPI0032DA2590
MPEIGDAYLLSHNRLVAAHPHLVSLVQEGRQTAFLSVLHRGRVIYVDPSTDRFLQSTSSSAPACLPTYPMATGRVLLSGLTEEAASSRR